MLDFLGGLAILDMLPIDTTIPWLWLPLGAGRLSCHHGQISLISLDSVHMNSPPQTGDAAWGLGPFSPGGMSQWHEMRILKC